MLIISSPSVLYIVGLPEDGQVGRNILLRLKVYFLHFIREGSYGWVLLAFLKVRLF
jgi:hypothetical protein